MTCYKSEPQTVIKLCDFLAEHKISLTLKQQGNDEWTAVLSPVVSRSSSFSFNSFWCPLDITAKTQDEVLALLALKGLTGQTVCIERGLFRNQVLDLTYTKVVP